MSEDVPDEKEEADKTRYSEAMSYLIMAVKTMAKTYKLSPMEAIGVFKVVEDTILSGGLNIEMAVIMQELQKQGILPSRGSPSKANKPKNEGYI
jgi:hypothetical protein